MNTDSGSDLESIFNAREAELEELNLQKLQRRQESYVRKDKNNKVIIPKYDLKTMFSDDRGVDYKLGCKYDLQYETRVDFEN
jgi:hypothetical protein